MTGQGKRVALVLGSGGARGYAHIGAIQVLAERGYEVVAVAGSSMGALVGGLLCAGKLDEYTDWVSTLSQRDVLRLLDPALLGPGAIRLERVLARMSEILDGALIEELPIPYTAVATDIGARREVWFSSGPVDVAIRASVAIPGVITPIMVNGRLLVDGGVLNPVPMEPVIGVDADFTLAVNLSGERPRGASSGPAWESSAERPPNEWLDRFLKGAAGVWENDFVASILSRFGRGHDDDAPTPEPVEPAFGQAPPGLGITDVTGMSLDAMGALITRFRLAALPPDVVVTLPAEAGRSTDFHRANELIGIGRVLTEEALDEAFPPEPAPSAADHALELEAEGPGELTP
ncbi:MAG: patatin-like phospholipase family protein [Actinobacteria bacterium]|nr:patatin-like phospholipase family protein [Actinomycetota bacterium]